MAKLTLSVDSEVVAGAKQYAKSKGLSVSSMVETYLRSVSRKSGADDDPPVLKRLRGIIKQGSVEEYRKHLAAKYK